MNMSRYEFVNIINNKKQLRDEFDLDNGESLIDEPLDREGYGLSEWFDMGIVGWDPGLETYYLQCIEINGGDELAWWIGTSYKEIELFENLTTLINKIFNDQIKFEFTDSIQKVDNRAQTN